MLASTHEQRKIEKILSEKKSPEFAKLFQLFLDPMFAHETKSKAKNVKYPGLLTQYCDKRLKVWVASVNKK